MMDFGLSEYSVKRLSDADLLQKLRRTQRDEALATKSRGAWHYDYTRHLRLRRHLGLLRSEANERGVEIPQAETPARGFTDFWGAVEEFGGAA